MSDTQHEQQAAEQRQGQIYLPALPPGWTVHVILRGPAEAVGFPRPVLEVLPPDTEGRVPVSSAFLDIAGITRSRTSHYESTAEGIRAAVQITRRAETILAARRVLTEEEAALLGEAHHGE